MKAIKKLLNTTAKLVAAIVLAAILVTWIVLFFAARDTAIGLVKPILWTLLVVALSWLAIHFGVKAWRKRKRSEFDQAVAAKEGIQDRRREWQTWTEELEKQGIDRYELPFYLLVGEPQSGKSVLLHNSDLHFPFGQNRLSGVGGTRGCDWWFTEEAVILDLAGRLFTHEGGATDRLEFEAFLELLYEFRPLCPANGVILVIPCDSLLSDDAEQCAAKATKIQNALLTLTTKLQAQLPVYLVLTKGDQIFGFAESVHRLDVERRHQMLGWSRPAEKIDAPFDLAEVLAGFEGLVQRARLLRAHMSAGARLPEALPEVDRMYAFPHELAGMQPNLETYLKRIFTASSITDRVLFRGLYLTSGLQSGVPIAKVCTELFGQAGEADMRDLQALFSKPRAYFIKDLIRSRVFGERGLVRPTQGRVQQTRRVSIVGYGLSGLVALASVVFAAVYLITGDTDARQRTYGAALDGADVVVADARAGLTDLLFRLQQVADAIDLDPHAYEKAFVDPREEFRALYRELFDARLLPRVQRMALEAIERDLSDGGSRDHAQLLRACLGLAALLGDVDFSSSGVRADVLACLPNASSGRTTDPGKPPLDLAAAFARRSEYGEPDGMLLMRDERDVETLVRLCQQAVRQLEAGFVPGAPTQPGGELGFMLAWQGAEEAREVLVDPPRVAREGRAIELARQFAGSLRALERIENEDLVAGAGGRVIKLSDVLIQSRALGMVRSGMLDFVAEHQRGGGQKKTWPRMDGLLHPFVEEKFEGHEGMLNLSSVGLHFGSEDAGQTLFQISESAIGTLTGEIAIGSTHDPKKDLDVPAGLRQVCDNALPLELTDGALGGLAQRFRYVGRTVLEAYGTGSQNFEAFAAQCTQFSQLFRAGVQTPEQALGAVLGSGASVRPGELCVPLVVELADLHREIEGFVDEKDVVGNAAEALRRWQEHLESLLFAHVQSCRPAEEWVPAVTPEGDLSEDAWGVLQALARCAELRLKSPGKYPLKNEAEDVQRDAFFALARQLENRWEARPIGELEETKASVRELDTLADRVRTRLSNAEALGVGGYLEAWANRVDSVLVARLSLLVEAVQRVWEPDMRRGTFRDSVDAGFRELNRIQEKIDESQRSGMDSLTPILSALRVDGKVTNWLGLPQVRAAVDRLSECKIPTTASEVQNDPEYVSLVSRMRSVLEQSGAQDYGGYLAQTYADLGLDNPAPPKNAGIRLVRETKKRLGQAILGEVQRSYLGELEALCGKSMYRVVLDALFWDPAQEPLDHSDVEVRDGLEKLLHPRTGDLFQLMKKYRLAGGERPLAALVFPAEHGSEDEWAACHRFLFGLQEFLFAGGAKNLRDATFSFTIRPQVGVAGSLWALDTIDEGERRDAFFYPGDKSSEDLAKAGMGKDMDTRLRVADWGFAVSRPDRALLLIWSKQQLQSEARTDPDRYYYSVRSCLAPLVLAWCGTPVDDVERTEFDVDITPERARRTAPLRLEFDHPLPLRPPRP